LWKSSLYKIKNIKFKIITSHKHPAVLFAQKKIKFEPAEKNHGNKEEELNAGEM
jgi:hypothetical protein